MIRAAAAATVRVAAVKVHCKGIARSRLLPAKSEWIGVGDTHMNKAAAACSKQDRRSR